MERRCQLINAETPVKVPFVDLNLQYKNHREAFEKALIETAASTEYILGPEVSQFEKSFADFLEAKQVIGVASGTDALRLSCLALDLKPGDEILVPANTFIASVLGINELGAKFVPVDVDPVSHLMDLADAKHRITPRTKGIIPVHLYGQIMNMDSLVDFSEQHGLFFIEDACQAHGAKWKGKSAGTFGVSGCFSFFPSKNLGAFGDGGAIAVNDIGMAKKLQQLRNYGSTKKYHHDICGTNSRLDSLQAAVLSIKMKYLEDWNKKRFQIACHYAEKLKGLTSIIPPTFDQSKPENHVFHLFVATCDRRDELQVFLTKHGIQTGVHYPVPIYLHKAFSSNNYPPGTCPVAEELSKKIISLPMFPEMSEEQVDYVVQVISEF
jgi:dTDP-4-amino-4,6-dideoxygalactose transaminase